MVRQTPINPGRSTHVRHSLSGLVHDAITLCELQVQLLAVDLRDARRGGMKALIALGIGAILGLACLPVLLIAGAHAVIDFLVWPAWAAYGVVALTALAVAGGLAWFGYRKLMRSLKTVGRSRDEFMTTLSWFKNSLRPEETSAPFDEIDEWRGPDVIRPSHRSL